MLLPMPYFKTNENWYIPPKRRKDGSVIHCQLTEEGKKIPEVVQSYKEYYEAIDGWVDPGFYTDVMNDTEKDYRADLKAQGKTQEEIDAIIKKWRFGE